MPLLRTWNKAICGILSTTPEYDDWLQSMALFRLGKEDFADRMEALDAYLDHLDELLEKWANEHGAWYTQLWISDSFLWITVLIDYLPSNIVGKFINHLPILFSTPFVQILPFRYSKLLPFFGSIRQFCSHWLVTWGSSILKLWINLGMICVFHRITCPISTGKM